MDASLKYASGKGFYLDLSLSYLDAEVTAAADSIFVEGGELGDAPTHSFSAVAAQDFEFPNGNLLTVTANLNHVDDFLQGTLNTAANMLGDMRTEPSYTIVNANVTYRFGTDSEYAFSLFGNNLTNEHYRHSRPVQNGNAVLGDVTPGNALSMVVTCTLSRATTRTYGASFTVDF